MASPFMDVLEKMLDENEDDHDNLLSDDEQSMDEDQSGDAGECTDGSDQDYRNLIVQSDIDFPDDDDQSDQDGSHDENPASESEDLFSGSDEDWVCFELHYVFKPYSMRIYKRKFFVYFNLQ